MRRLGSGLLLAAVLALMAASGPVPVAVGSGGLPANPNRAKADTSLAAPRPAATATPTIDDETDERAKAVQLLSRLKPAADQPAARPREPAVELPRRIAIPALSLETGFEYVGLAADGAMDVPKDPNQVAWYRLGPRPGEQGNAVVAGHVDWGGKTAAFWGLSRLKAGDLVEITGGDDRRYQFVIQWVRWYDAAQAPVEEVFGQSDRTELTLITCGGVFDPQSRQYLSRVVARATLR